MNDDVPLMLFVTVAIADGGDGWRWILPAAQPFPLQPVNS